MDLGAQIESKLVAPAKRPVRQLSIHEKLEAIQRVHEGESKASVARIIGVPESTLRGWCKNEDKLHAMANKSSPSPEPVCLDGKRDGPSEAKRAKTAAADASADLHGLHAGLHAAKKPVLDEALWFWLRNQQEQQRQERLDAVVTENSSWFWRWYKHYGFQSPPQEEPLPEPLPLVKSKSTLDTVLLNLNNNNVQAADEAKENKGTQSGEVSEDEDDPPETPQEALKHGEKFLRWLECCSDPSVTAVQLLQFRYLLNNVRACAERRANKAKTAPRAKRK